MLKQDITKKEVVNEFFKLKLNLREDKKYQIEAMKDSAVYNEVAKDQLLELYNLISQKNYPENESA